MLNTVQTVRALFSYQNKGGYVMHRYEVKIVHVDNKQRWSELIEGVECLVKKDFHL